MSHHLRYWLHVQLPLLSFVVLSATNCKTTTVPLEQKERFYQQKGRLPVLPSQEVSDFINRCLAYDPMERPSFRVVLRELTEFMKTSAYFYFLFSYLYCCCGTSVVIFFFLVTDPDISPRETLPSSGHTIFHKRFLKMKHVLGAVSVK